MRLRNHPGPFFCRFPGPIFHTIKTFLTRHVFSLHTYLWQPNVKSTIHRHCSLFFQIICSIEVNFRMILYYKIFLFNPSGRSELFVRNTLNLNQWKRNIKTDTGLHHTVAEMGLRMECGLKQLAPWTLKILKNKNKKRPWNQPEPLIHWF